MTVQVGDLAPDFVLPSQTGDKIRLSDFRGKKKTVLAFFPLAWTPV
jgi:peroxiredoxin